MEFREVENIMTQFPRMTLKNPQGTTYSHNPFEIKTYKSVYDYINKNLPKTEKSTEISAKIHLKKRLKPYVEKSQFIKSINTYLFRDNQHITQYQIILK